MKQIGTSKTVSGKNVFSFKMNFGRKIKENQILRI